MDYITLEVPYHNPKIKMPKLKITKSESFLWHIFTSIHTTIIIKSFWQYIKQHKLRNFNFFPNS